MKKAAGLIFMIVLVVGGSFILKGMLPIMPVFGTSMEPTLTAGSIVTVEEVLPTDVKVGDIIVFQIPEAVREYYNYPPVVAHRVIEVNDNSGFITYRTRGDNTGEEPFAVRPQDLRGRIGDQIPYVGFPLLFLQSQQGLVFMIVAICVLGAYLYRGEIGERRRRVQDGVFAPVLEESQRTSRVLENKIDGSQRALEQFSSAMGEYAQHLKSHTAAVQGMSAASQELKNGAAEQNKVLSRLTEIMEEEMGYRRKFRGGSYEIPLENEPAPSIEDLIVTAENPRKRWATGLEFEDWLEN